MDVARRVLDVLARRQGEAFDGVVRQCKEPALGLPWRELEEYRVSVEECGHLVRGRRLRLRERGVCGTLLPNFGCDVAPGARQRRNFGVEGGEAALITPPRQ